MFLFLSLIIGFSCASKLGYKINNANKNKELSREEKRKIKKEEERMIMRNTVKVFNLIFLIINIVVCVLHIVFNVNELMFGITLAIHFTLSSLIYYSLEEETQSITLGVLSLIFFNPVVGIMYLCWEPKNGKTLY